jgi:hypothetical protein
MLVVLEFNVADVEKPVATHAEIDEDRLDAGLDIDDAAFIDVADAVLDAPPFDIKLLQHAILEDSDPAFFGLEDVDQHFLLHSLPFVAKNDLGRAR